MRVARNILLIIVLLSVNEVKCLIKNSNLVKLAQGTVRGYKGNDAQVYEFFGIPYATIPKGHDKFKAPLPGPTWNGTLDAVERFIACPQNPLLYPNVPTREDCLIANIITPIIGKNHPVLVYVHGGAYQVGFGHAMSPKALVESQKIVAVTFNYRLGAHGFLCLGTKGAPGNAGMKDQVALLRWVQHNIASFGGNPDDVTIAGYSAGSSAVGLLLLSNATRGLFKKAIPESGADVGTWSVQIDPVENAKEYAKQLGFSEVDDMQALEEFYQTLHFDELTSDSFDSKKDSTFHFTPCVERYVGVDMFLHDNPVNIIKQGQYKKVPMLYGFTNMEGLFRMPHFYHWICDMNARFSKYLPADLHFQSDLEREDVSKQIKTFYSNKNPLGLFSAKEFTDYFTDIMFAYPVLRSINLRIISGNENIFLYEYSFTKKYSTKPNFPGADHCSQTEAILDDTVYIESEEDFTEEYRIMRSTLRGMWLNFVITGKPVSENSTLPWPPTTAAYSPHMSFGNIFVLEGPLLEERVRFWGDIYDKYYRHPKPPKSCSSSVCS